MVPLYPEAHVENEHKPGPEPKIAPSFTRPCAPHGAREEVWQEPRDWEREAGSGSMRLGKVHRAQHLEGPGAWLHALLVPF